MAVVDGTEKTPEKIPETAHETTEKVPEKTAMEIVEKPDGTSGAERNDDPKEAIEDIFDMGEFKKPVAVPDFTCVLCGSKWNSARQRNGHMAACKKKEKQNVSVRG